MTDAILVLNAGSSSIKFSVFVDEGVEPAFRFGGQIEGLYTAPRFAAKDASGASIGARAWDEGTRLGHDGAIDYLVKFLREHRENHVLVAVGHRVVHGGLEFSKPVLIDPQVVAKLEKFIPLAPLHQPHNLTPIRIVIERIPQLPQVACFDTAFHRAQPEVAQAFALPRSITDRGVRRYGFHGLSYEYIASTLPRFDAKAATGRVVVAHLGNGASMCAIRTGKSIASTMGFTAVDGLPMGTRCGTIDPGVMLYLMDELKMDARAIEKLIYQQSGLLGVSGISSDMRALLASSDSHAKLAIELFVYRITRELGSLAAALGGLDALVFTGGIGEHAVAIRERVCRGAAWLGVELDSVANNSGQPRIS
ncbi:MAG TPA: acetate/propionate family kinase, partial [Burkholderiales bacterium]|nr:acetate/propionate family kinase [Burkholderiales bacterium]